MLRVAFDTSSLRGNKTGIGRYTESLIGALRAYASEIEVVELADNAAANQRTDWRIWREQIRIPRLARAARPDLLHLTGFAAPWQVPCPLVLTVHDLIGMLFPQIFPRLSRFYWGRYLPFTLRYANRLVADSEHTRQDIVRLAGIPAGRIRVIYPGRDERFQPLADPALRAAKRLEFGLPGSYLLFVSTLEPRKGIDTLLAAYALIAGQIQAHLMLVGQRGWGWEELLAQVARQGLEPRVHWIDYAPADRLPALYGLAEAYVFPSRYEGFGLTPLEAMSCGTPVISSNAASLPEVVGDAGLLVPPGDVPGLAAAMLRVLRDPGLCAHLSAQGLVQAARFSWKRAARELVEVYQGLNRGR